MATVQHIITHICGGLGNQMFQHAMGRALALRHGASLLWDVTWFESMEGCTPRSFMLPVFPALVERVPSLRHLASQEQILALKYEHRGCIATLWDRLRKRPLPHAATCIQEPFSCNYGDIAPITPPAYLQGYWQNEHYFADFATEITHDFAFPPLSEKSQAIKRRICNAENAVSVHIRRGDYAHNSLTNYVHGLCTADYYNNALEALKCSLGAMQLFVFSDEPEWASEHFDNAGISCTVINTHTHTEREREREREAHHDMHLMSLCKHHILANSSFSWWGAWLAGGDGITIAPKQWFNEPSMQHKNPCPARWILM